MYNSITFQPKIENDLLSWYESLMPRHLDITNSGAKDFFVIDGDSLIANFILNPKINKLYSLTDEEKITLLGPKAGTWSPLQVSWLVEKFIMDLKNLGCVFDVIFFNIHMVIWGKNSQHLLFRNCMVRHLSVFAKTHFNVHIISNWWCQEWQDYFDRYKPRFVLMGDGSTEYIYITNYFDFQPYSSSKLEESVGNDYNQNKIVRDFMHRTSIWRSFMISILARGASIALFPGLSFCDNRVITFMIEMSGITDTKLYSNAMQLAIDIFDEYQYYINNKNCDINLYLEKLLNRDPYHWRESKIITTVSLANMHILNIYIAKLVCIFVSFLPSLPLELRSHNCVDFTEESINIFIDKFTESASSIMFQCIHLPVFSMFCSNISSLCDLCDFFDDKMFRVFIATIMELKSSTSMNTIIHGDIILNAQQIWDSVCMLTNTLNSDVIEGIHFLFNMDFIINSKYLPNILTPIKLTCFNQRLFNKILNDIHFDLDSQPLLEYDNEIEHLEIYHWHSHSLLGNNNNDFSVEKRLRMKQLYLRFMHRYAESFHGVKGLYFKPILGPSDKKKTTIKSVKQSKNAELIIKLNIQRKYEKQKSEAYKIFERLQKEVLSTHGLDAKINIISKAIKESTVLNKSAEILIKANLFLIQHLIDKWTSICKINKPFKTNPKGYNEKEIYVIIKIYKTIKHVYQEFPTWHQNKSLISIICKLLDLLGFDECSRTIHDQVNTIYKSNRLLKDSLKYDEDHSAIFDFCFPNKNLDISMGMSDIFFQLHFCGHLFDRNTGTRPDSRVPFDPDDWQIKLLDIIDSRESALVCAPTSSGKTFIAFYAMEQVISSSDDDIVIYISPTKALCNQTAAEVYARFGMKKYAKAGKSVFGIYTRDYRHEAMNCQILICVPEIMEILLLSPEHNNNWIHHIKYIIFDEIHMIGEMEGGSVWERLILLAPCPILALSATISNKEEFHEWISSVQYKKGIKMHLVTTDRRYSDLKKYIYVPYKCDTPIENFNTNSNKNNSLVHINPIGTISVKTLIETGFSNDMKLLPEECLQIYNLMTKNIPKEYHSHIKKINPLTYFYNKGFIKKDDSDKFEVKIKDNFHSLAKKKETTKFIEDIISEINTNNFNSFQELSNIQDIHGWKWIKSQFPRLVEELSAQDKLPGIVFCLDRRRCTELALFLANTMENLEAEKRKNNEVYQRKKKEAEKIDELYARSVKKEMKQYDRKIKNKHHESDYDNSEVKPLFDWQKHDPDFTLVDAINNVSTEELEDIGLKRLQQTLSEEHQPLLKALKRGIGIHHAGMPRKYLEIVEVLFRRKYIKIVIATGTLALGISAPCKSVVFVGNSIFLSGINYRQMSGRAGRRGYDLIGHVVFFGTHKNKISALLSSPLTPLCGHFIVSTTLVLRALCLATQSSYQENNMSITNKGGKTRLQIDNSEKYATKAIESLFNNSFSIFVNGLHNDQIKYHLRFSIEYLIREKTIRSDGTLIGLAGMISHLYYTEPSNLIFASLLRKGLLRDICRNISTNSEHVIESVLVILANIFNRIPLRRIEPEYYKEVILKSSSKVILPPLPPTIIEFITNYNKDVLKIYTDYVVSYALYAITKNYLPDDHTLPLSNIKFTKLGSSKIEYLGNNVENKELKIHTIEELLNKQSRRVIARSLFSALSGCGDQFDDIFDISSHLRPGLRIDKNSIPLLDMSDIDSPLNAYIVDFFSHGQLHTIEIINGIREGESFKRIKDMLLIIKTIYSSLYLRPNKEDNDILLTIKILMEKYETRFNENIK